MLNPRGCRQIQKEAVAIANDAFRADGLFVELDERGRFAKSFVRRSHRNAPAHAIGATARRRRFGLDEVPLVGIVGHQNRSNASCSAFSAFSFASEAAFASIATRSSSASSSCSATLKSMHFSLHRARTRSTHTAARFFSLY